eukprot:2178121-Rhodomonas_salina.1
MRYHSSYCVPTEGPGTRRLCILSDYRDRVPTSTSSWHSGGQQPEPEHYPGTVARTGTGGGKPGPT